MTSSSNLTTILSRRQYQVLLDAGFDPPSEGLHGGLRRIWWPAEDTPKMFRAIKSGYPRHMAKIIPYHKLVVALFTAWRHARATGQVAA